MNYSEKQYRQKISLGQSGNALVTLIVIHLVMFVIFAFLKVVWHFRYSDGATALSQFNQEVLTWFTLPADLSELGRKPWAVLTHFFIHVSIWQVFANMLWLWCFGYIMQDLTGNRKIIPVFLYGAIAGAGAFVLAYNLIPSLSSGLPHATALGASAGIMAVAIATTTVSPGYRIFPMLAGGIPLWVLTTIYVIIAFATIPVQDTATMASNLAGALIGFLFLFFLRRGYDWSDWMSEFFDWVSNLFNPDRPKKGKSVREELFYKSTVSPYKKTSNITQQRIDEILDKINQKGYQQLTEEEKELLRRASQEDL
ncbi:MAG TPA: rhomboid family intramembrane serine protease [Chitinophagaceae bacterium]|nr:rhomboid family intramembrane serine protease [Chitinophagaceae bacterium]